MMRIFSKRKIIFDLGNRMELDYASLGLIIGGLNGHSSFGVVGRKGTRAGHTVEWHTHFLASCAFRTSCGTTPNYKSF